ICSCSRYADATGRPARSKKMQRVPVVPWSIAATYSGIASHRIRESATSCRARAEHRAALAATSLRRLRTQSLIRELELGNSSRRKKMRTSRFLGLSSLVVVATSLSAAGCAQKNEAAPPAASAEAAAPKTADDGKIPITTASAEARAEYVQGRTLVDNLQITNSIAHFQKAVELDPAFALGELALANSSPTGTAFFEHLNKAAALSDKASNGEKLMIHAAQSGANADFKGQAAELQ